MEIHLIKKKNSRLNAIIKKYNLFNTLINLTS